MPDMRHSLAIATTHLLLAASLAGCGSSGPDEASKFAGAWHFAAGSMVNAVCMAPLPPNMPPFDLAERGVTIDKVDNSHIRANVQLQMDQPPCVVKLAVSGATATADPNQACMLLIVVQMTPGNYPLQIKSLTLTMSGDGTIATELSGTAAGFCNATGGGTLVPGPGDAGATD
jgi:hypothetical protein